MQYLAYISKNNKIYFPNWTVMKEWTKFEIIFSDLTVNGNHCDGLKIDHTFFD